MKLDNGRFQDYKFKDQIVSITSQAFDLMDQVSSPLKPSLSIR